MDIDDFIEELLSQPPALVTHEELAAYKKRGEQKLVEARYQSEVWLPITDYPFSGEYEVSSAGRVRRNGKILKQSNRSGYLGLSLSKNGERKSYTVHRLVARAFIPLGNHKPCVNHIDGNRQHNWVSNLEWCTYSENELHAYEALGKVNSHSKLTAAQAKEVEQRINNGETQRSIAKDFGVHYSAISHRHKLVKDRLAALNQERLDK